MPVYGTDLEIAICYQTSFDTISGIANSGQSIALISESFNDQMPSLTSESIRGVVDRGDVYSGPKEVTGDIEAEVEPKSIGFLLASILERTGSVNSDSLYTHTFKPRTADAMEFSPQRPMTVVKKWGSGANDKLNFYNLNASNIEFSCAAGEFLKVKIGCIGGRNDGGTPTDHTASYPGLAPFTFDQCSFSFAGAAEGAIKSLSISIDEGYEPKHTLVSSNDSWPSRVVRSAFRTGTINVTMSFDSSSQYIAFRGDNATTAPFEQRMHFNFSQAIECQSGYPHRLNIDMPSVEWESFDDSTNGVGEVELSLTGKIKYNVNSGNMIDITLVDTHAAY